MKFLRVGASVVALATASPSMRAQAPVPEVPVQTIGAVHVVALPAPEGIIRVYVSADAAAGDTISGIISPDPSGPVSARDDHLARLDSFVVEWQGVPVPVSRRRYEWQIPRTLTTGSGALLLRDGQGRLVSRASLPVDPVPSPHVSSAADGLEFPTEVDFDFPAVIRGPFDGTLAAKTVSVNGAQAELMAASPRQLAFQVPANVAGPVAVELVSDGRALGGAKTLHVLVARVDPLPVLRPGQRGTLTVAVSGLRDIAVPVSLTLLNQSPAIARVESIDQPIAIRPGQARQGTFEVKRQIIGVRGGRGQILWGLGSAPLGQFDVERSMNRTLADWQAQTGVAIDRDANERIQRSVLAAPTKERLDDFLRTQQANQADVQAVFEALLLHYCYDLRDDSLSRRLVAAGGWVSGPRLRLVALGQGQPGGVQITAAGVERLTFSSFLSGLSRRFNEQQAFGKLWVSSRPDQLAVTIDDGEQRGATDRIFAIPVGPHQVVVAGRPACRRQVTVSAGQKATLDCGAQ